MRYTPYVREKEFINKVHKHLPTAIYRWKINDPYHGGVPDAFYAGKKNHCFIEYKYQDTLPKKPTSQIKIALTSQQRLWLNNAKENNIICYAVLASGDSVLMSNKFDQISVSKEEFEKESITFKKYIDRLINICLEVIND